MYGTNPSVLSMPVAGSGIMVASTTFHNPGLFAIAVMLISLWTLWMAFIALRRIAPRFEA